MQNNKIVAMVFLVVFMFMIINTNIANAPVLPTQQNSKSNSTIQPVTALNQSQLQNNSQQSAKVTNTSSSMQTASSPSSISNPTYYQVTWRVDYNYTTIKTAYPLAVATYEGNGKYIYSVSVAPTSSVAVFIYNLTGTSFISASNSYSSVSVSPNSNYVIINGLPANIISTISFSCNQNKNAYSLVKNATLYPDASRIGQSGQPFFPSYMGASSALIGDELTAVGSPLNFNDNTADGLTTPGLTVAGGTASVTQSSGYINYMNIGSKTPSGTNFMDLTYFNTLVVRLTASANPQGIGLDSYDLNNYECTNTIVSALPTTWTTLYISLTPYLRCGEAGIPDRGTYQPIQWIYNMFFYTNGSSLTVNVDNIEFIHMDSQMNTTVGINATTDANSNSISFGSAQGPFLGNYMAHFVYYSTGSVSLQYANSSIMLNESSYTNTWNSQWTNITVSNYIYNEAFSLNSTGLLYFAYLELYNFNYTYSNDKKTGKLTLAGHMQDLTDFGLQDASLINVTIGVYNSSLSLLETDYVLTDSLGYFSYSSFTYTFTNTTYNFLIKIASITNYAYTSYYTGFDSTNGTLIYNGWWGEWHLSTAQYVSAPQSMVWIAGSLYTYVSMYEGNYNSGNKVNNFIMSFDAMFDRSGSEEQIYSIYFFMLNPVQNSSMIDGCKVILYLYVVHPSLLQCGSTILASNNTILNYLNTPWNTMKITGTTNSDGSIQLSFYFNGIQVLTGSESIYYNGYFGFGGYAYQNVVLDTYIDNFYLIKYTIVSVNPYTAIDLISNFQIDYSLIKNTDSYIVSQDSLGGNLYLKIYMDNVFQGIYKSLQTIPKLTKIGIHTFSYLIIADDNYLIASASFVNSTYLVYLQYSANLNTFVISSDYISIYYTINENSTVYVYENNTLITSKINTEQDNLKWNRNTSASYVSVGILMQNTDNFSEYKWFNTSYTNDLVIVITNLAFYTNATNVIITWTSLTTSVSVIVKEDGSLLGTYTATTIVYPKSLIVGMHYVSVQFTRDYYTSSAFIFTYSVNQFIITFSQFYTNSTSILYQFSSDQSFVIASIYENGVFKVNGSENTLIAYAKSPMVGQHFITIVFSKANNNNLTYSFTYDVASFSITSIQFYTNSTSVILTFESSTTGVTTSIYENGVFKVNGSQNSLISYPKNSNVGTYFVSVVFVKIYNTNVTYSFTYSVNQFSIFNTMFYTNASDVLFSFQSDYANVHAYMYQSNVLETNGSENTLITYPISSSIGTYFVSITFALSGHNNVTSFYSYTVNQFSITSLVFYPNVTNYIITYKASLSSVNITVIDDGITRVSNLNNQSLTLSKDASQGTHFVTLIFSARGQNNVSYTETYLTDGLTFTTPFQYYIDYGSSITMYYALSQKANITVTFDNQLLVNITNTQIGNYTISAALANASTMFNVGLHQMIFIAQRSGLTPITQYITWSVPSTSPINPTPVTVNNNSLFGILVVMGILLTIIIILLLGKRVKNLEDSFTRRVLEILLNPELSAQQAFHKFLELKKYIQQDIRKKNT